MKALVVFAVVLGLGSSVQTPDDGWLTWSAAKAEAVGKAAYVQGRVGGFWDTRILSTDRAYNYKLAATWLNRDVVRATARMIQLTERLSDNTARQLVAEGEAAGDTVVMVEVDPREGSGVVPLDWVAVLQPIMPGGSGGRPLRGVNNPRLRDVKGLRGVLRRNYDYDRFWVVFS